MATYTPKRLSDMELAEIASVNARENAMIAEWAPFAIDARRAHEQREKLLSHIAALTAPPSQGKVERAREISHRASEAYFDMDERTKRNENGLMAFERVVTAFITQALTESSGQTDPEAAAILRTLGCVPDSTDLSETDAKVSVIFLRRLIESSGQGTDGAE